MMKIRKLIPLFAIPTFFLIACSPIGNGTFPHSGQTPAPTPERIEPTLEPSLATTAEGIAEEKLAADLKESIEKLSFDLSRTNLNFENIRSQFLEEAQKSSPAVAAKQMKKTLEEKVFPRSKYFIDLEKLPTKTQITILAGMLKQADEEIEQSRIQKTLLEKITITIPTTSLNIDSEEASGISREFKVPEKFFFLTQLYAADDDLVHLNQKNGKWLIDGKALESRYRNTELGEAFNNLD
ncbi:hypothetical protein KRX54_04965 [Actinomycetaceae bacterium TAE3-ERU4]|nr:hypothetical protein [Actinomycetaceae bacterium TAE3-ERU4]